MNYKCECHEAVALKARIESLEAKLKAAREALEYIASGNAHCFTCAVDHAQRALAALGSEEKK